MKLPVDVGALAFLVVVAPAPVVDFETKKAKADENGEPLYTVQLVAMGEDDAEILPVKVAGASALRAGTPVKVSGLVVTPWKMGDRSGVSFKAAAIEALAPVGSNNGSGEKAGRS